MLSPLVAKRVVDEAASRWGRNRGCRGQATAEPDPRHRERIARRREDLDTGWLGAALVANRAPWKIQAARSRFVIVDCLTMWLGNLLAQNG